MTNKRILREVFDRDNNFVTVRPVKFNGRSYGPGQPFDKTQVTTRRLRQLYDARSLRMIPNDAPVEPERPPVQIKVGNANKPQKIQRVRL